MLHPTGERPSASGAGGAAVHGNIVEQVHVKVLGSAGGDYPIPNLRRRRVEPVARQVVELFRVLFLHPFEGHLVQFFIHLIGFKPVRPEGGAA